MKVIIIMKDRLFTICQHGWLNIQALQINLSYRNNEDLTTVYNRLRPLLPYLIAVTASSPMVEGHLPEWLTTASSITGKTKKRSPVSVTVFIPEKIRTVDDYHTCQEEIYAELRMQGADILCEEWVNSSGLIIRFSRNCLEIKALDEQECIRSDMAVCALVQSLLRCPSLPIRNRSVSTSGTY